MKVKIIKCKANNSEFDPNNIGETIIRDLVTGQEYILHFEDKEMERRFAKASHVVDKYFSSEAANTYRMLKIIYDEKEFSSEETADKIVHSMLDCVNEKYRAVSPRKRKKSKLIEVNTTVVMQDLDKNNDFGDDTSEILLAFNEVLAQNNINPLTNIIIE